MLRDEFKGEGCVELVRKVGDVGVLRCLVVWVGGIGRGGVRLLLGVRDESISRRSVGWVGGIGRDGGGLVRARFSGGCIDGKGRHSRGSSRCLDLFEFPGSRSGFIVIFARASFFCSFDLI